MKRVVMVVAVRSRTDTGATASALRLQRELNNRTNTTATIVEVPSNRSVQVTKDIILSPAECTALSTLAACKTINVQPTVNQLVAITGYDDSTVHKALRNLRNLRLATADDQPSGYEITAAGEAVLRQIIQITQAD